MAYIYTLRPKDPFFLEVGVIDSQKMVHSSDKVIITVKMEATELLLNLG